MELKGDKGPIKHQPSHPFGRRITNAPAESLDEKPTVWQLYNHRASLVDRELIKDWTEGLNTLLIFAALYSAVLTAFIVESMNLLEADSGAATFDVLLVISMQLANQSVGPYQKQEFIAPPFAVRVNGFFFFSISCSLVAALGAVLALQWVGSYDAGLNASSPEDRALQRHFRYLGVLDWNMPEIIAALPLLIFMALGLFFAGLTDWLWHVHKGLAGIILVAMGTSTLFYITTTFIGVFSPGAPFRTPLSRSLPLVFARCLSILHSLWRILRNTSISVISRALTRKFVSIKNWLRKRRRNRVKPIATPLKRLSRLIDEKPFVEREEEKIRAQPLHHLSSLLWILGSIEISQHSRSYFIQLLEAVLSLSTDQISEEKLNAPWVRIYSFLCRPYQGKRRYEDYSTEELPEATFLLRSLSAIGIWECDQSILSFLHSFNNAPIKEVSLAARIAVWKHTPRRTEEWSSMFQDTIADACRNVELLNPRFLQQLLINIEAEQKRTPARVYSYVVDTLADMCGASQKIDRSLSLIDQTKSISPHILNMIVRIMTKTLGRSEVEDGSPVENLVAETEYRLQFDPAFRFQDVSHWYRAVYRQLVRRLARPSSKQEVRPILEDLCRIVDSTIWNHTRFIPARSIHTLVSVITPLCASYLERGRESFEGERHFCQMGVRLVSLALPTSYDFDPNHQREHEYSEWFTRNLLGFEAFMSNQSEYTGYNTPDVSELVLQHLLKVSLPFYNEIRTTLNGDQRSRLSKLKIPTVRLIASMGGADDKSVLTPPISTVTDTSWGGLLKFWWTHYSKSPRVDRLSLITLLRHMITNGNPEVAALAADIVLNDKIDMSSSECFTLLGYPGLSIILGSQAQIPPSQLTDLLMGIRSFDWFPREFLHGKGLTWMEQALKKKQCDIAYAVILVISIIDTTDGHEHIGDCVQFLKNAAKLPVPAKDAPDLFYAGSLLYSIFQRQAFERDEEEAKRSRQQEPNEEPIATTSVGTIDAIENSPNEIEDATPAQLSRTPSPPTGQSENFIESPPLGEGQAQDAGGNESLVENRPAHWTIGRLPDHSSEGPFNSDLLVPEIEELSTFRIEEHNKTPSNALVDRSNQWRYLVANASEKEWNAWRLLIEEVCANLSRGYIGSLMTFRSESTGNVPIGQRTRLRKPLPPAAPNAWRRVKTRAARDIFPSQAASLTPSHTPHLPEEDLGDEITPSIVMSILALRRLSVQDRKDGFRRIAHHIVTNPTTPLQDATSLAPEPINVTTDNNMDKVQNSSEAQQQVPFEGSPVESEEELASLLDRLRMSPNDMGSLSRAEVEETNLEWNWPIPNTEMGAGSISLDPLLEEPEGSREDEETT